MPSILPRVAFILAVGASLPAMSSPAANPAPPRTERRPVSETLHGVTLEDPYRWLEDQDAPATRTWIAEQEAHAQAVLGAVPQRAAFEARLRELMRQDDLSTPWVRGKRLFHSSRASGAQQASLVVREGLRGRERVLVDPARFAPDGTASVTLMSATDDGALMAYGVRRGGADEVEVRLMDVGSGGDLPDVLPVGRVSGVTFGDGGFFYSRWSPEGSRVLHHRLGRPVAEDAVIMPPQGPGIGLSAQVSPDGRWLLVTAWHGSAATRSSLYLQDLASHGPMEELTGGIHARFSGDVAGGTLYLHTDWLAPNGRILSMDLATPGMASCRELVPESRHPLDSFTLAGGRLVLRYLRDVRPVLEVRSLPQARLEHVVDAPGHGTLSEVWGSWSSSDAFAAFSSWNRPETILHVDLATGAATPWWTAETAFDPSRIVVEQVWFRSTDGAQVPMFLGRSKDARQDGRNACYLTGYGGFNLERIPEYSPWVAAWLESGGIVAMPNLRGGSEFGEAWHRGGMGERKQQTFDDFLAAAEWLVGAGWTTPARLGIGGRSNGGLLTGAALTQRPDLFGAVLIGYPLLDMVRYHQFLVASFWVPEYGSSEDPAQFRTLHAYSPYHRVVPGTKYPAVLLVTGDADTRVAPLHARKMTALLQASTGSDAPVLLHYDAEMGHSHGQPVDKQAADMANELAFLAWRLGVDGPASATAGGR